PSPRICCCPTNSSRLRGRSRSASGATSCIRSRPASPNRPPISEKYALAVASGEGGAYTQPGRPAEGASDYQRYLRTGDPAARPKRPEEQVHRDELLFQTVQHASELWLKLSWTEAEEATRLIQRGDLAAAERLLRRAVLGIRYVIAQLDMLEEMSPWEYQTI